MRTEAANVILPSSPSTNEDEAALGSRVYQALAQIVSNNQNVFGGARPEDYDQTRNNRVSLTVRLQGMDQVDAVRAVQLLSFTFGHNTQFKLIAPRQTIAGSAVAVLPFDNFRPKPVVKPTGQRFWEDIFSFWNLFTLISVVLVALVFSYGVFEVPHETWLRLIRQLVEYIVYLIAPLIGSSNSAAAAAAAAGLKK